MGTKQQSIIVGSESYSGRTKAEATASALSHLASFMDGAGFRPELVSSPDGSLGVVFRDANGFWSYFVQWKDEETIRGCVTSGVWDRKTAEHKVRRHLAQHVFHPNAPGTEKLAVGLIAPDDRDGLEDLVRWMSYQRHYFQARERGLDDNAAQHAADRAA